MSWKTDLGEEIRNARTLARKTQQELAKAIGVHENMVIRYEKGASVPSVQLLSVIALSLDKPEFTVRGIKVSFDRNGSGGGPKPVLQQLKLQFDAAGGVTVRIQPSATYLIVSDVTAAAS